MNTKMFELIWILKSVQKIKQHAKIIKTGVSDKVINLKENKIYLGLKNHHVLCTIRTLIVYIDYH